MYWQDGDSPYTVASDLLELVCLWNRLLVDGYWGWLKDGWSLLLPLPPELPLEVRFVLE